MRVTFQGLESEQHFAFQDGNSLTLVANEEKYKFEHMAGAVPRKCLLIKGLTVFW